MPIDLTKLPERLVTAARDRNLVPLVGAGISMQADMPPGKKAFPTWTEMLDELTHLAKAEGYMVDSDANQIADLVTRGKFLMAAQALRSAIPVDAFNQFIHDRFDPPDVKPGEVHRALFALKPLVIITTNYDRSLDDEANGP